MNILVTGNLGYNGSILVKHLKKAGHFIVGFDIGYFTESTFMPIRSFLPDIQILKDIRDITKSDIDKFDFDVFIHLAALSNDPLGELSPEHTYEINFEATKRLLGLAKTLKIEQFIFVSSCSAYGKLDENQCANEETTLEPLTAYAKSKVQSEQFLLSNKPPNMILTIMRCATMFGISPFLRLDLVVNNLTAQAFLYNKINIYSDGTPWRPLIHVNDFSIATLKLAESNSEGVFNVGFDTMNFTVKEIGIKVSELTGSELFINKNKTPDERSYRVDFSKIEKILGRSPTVSLSDGIKELLSFYHSFSLAKEDFESGKYNRIQTLKKLLAKKIVSNNLSFSN